MKRKFIYYIGPIDCIKTNGGNHEIIGSIIGKDTEWFLVERFNGIGDSSNDIKHVRMDNSKKPPRMKKKGKYIWIKEAHEDKITYIGTQTR